MRHHPLVLALLAGCAGSSLDRVVLIPSTADGDVVTAWARTIGDDRIVVEPSDSPLDAASGAKGLVIVLKAPSGEGGALPDGVDRERQVDDAFVVEGSDIGARLSGTSRVLEAFGWRFHHPQHTFKPDAIVRPDDLADLLTEHVPAIERRGLQLHTLHPIEGLYDLWYPTADLGRADAILDWITRNHGNYLQWVALDDITGETPLSDAWTAHTQAIVADAHARGVQVGIGIQLFGTGNLQRAFDLLDTVGTVDEQRAAMAPRLDRITSGLDWDVISLSFGEFFSEDPARFIQSLELTYDEIHARLPDAEVSTSIHVGNDLSVTYKDETFLYYFLGTKADRPIVPWIHSVMYYNLFEDAGGAYHHDQFDQHRAFMVDAVRNDKPVGYFPESQYWVAFDSPVPQSYPLYIRSRWTDLSKIQSEGRLHEHILFSTGWEWNAWLTDTATLRQTDHLDAAPCDAITWTYAPHGDAGAVVSNAMCAMADSQHTWLLEKRLTAYIASFDVIMEVGYGLGKISQPRRPLFRDLVALTGDAREAYRTDVANLATYAGEADAIAAPVDALGTDDPWIAEAQDALDIDAVRAHFAHWIARATLAKADGTDPGTDLDDAETLIQDAAVIVARRHAALWDPAPERLITHNDNPTIYQYGYLARAEELCFWHRELALARNAVEGTSLSVDGCGL